MRRYGAWMRAEAEKRIGHLYPKIEITAEMAAKRPHLILLATLAQSARQTKRLEAVKSQNIPSAPGK